MKIFSSKLTAPKGPSTKRIAEALVGQKKQPIDKVPIEIADAWTGNNRKGTLQKILKTGIRK